MTSPSPTASVAGFGARLRDARTEILSGLVVALALIPEAIGFSVICGRRSEGRPLRLCHDRLHHRLHRRAARR